jgi:hypothetical protein
MKWCFLIAQPCRHCYHSPDGGRSINRTDFNGGYSLSARSTRGRDACDGGAILSYRPLRTYVRNEGVSLLTGEVFPVGSFCARFDR